MVDYSHWDNFDDNSDTDDDIHRGEFSSENADELLQEIKNPRAWSTFLPITKHTAFILDCYRLRLDDDYKRGNHKIRGLYLLQGEDLRCKELRILEDFLCFMKMAKKNDCLPEDFDFPECLRLAPEPLKKPFTKADAEKIWGKENCFSVGRASLRRTAEQIYKCTMDEDHYCEIDLMEDEVSKYVDRTNFENSDPLGFQDIGGFRIWNRLFYTMFNDP